MFEFLVATFMAVMKVRYMTILQELGEANFIGREPGEKDEQGNRIHYLTIHMSLQEGLLLKLNSDTGRRQAAFERVTILLRETYPTPNPWQIPDASKWPLTLKVLPHLLNLVRCFDRSDAPIQLHLQFAELLADVGIELYDRGFTSDAWTLSEKAGEILNSLQQPMETQLRGNILTVRGLCTDTLGISKRAEGLEVRQRALQVRKKVFDDIHRSNITPNDEILLYNAETDLACSLQNFNRLEEVADICRKCYLKYRSWGTEEQYPYEYAKFYNHMAYVLRERGDTQEANRHSERGYELMSEGAPGTQITETFRFDWATIMFQSGDVDRAIREHKIVLDSRIQGCGKFNLLTLQSRLILGIMYYFIGDYNQAE